MLGADRRGCGRISDQLDLTVHFNSAERSSVSAHRVSPSVRYVLMPTVFSTRRLVRQVPDHTDLGLWHPALAGVSVGLRRDPHHRRVFLLRANRDAVRAKSGVPVVSSIHTNTPEYARITVDNLLGQRSATASLSAGEPASGLAGPGKPAARTTALSSSRPGDAGDGELWRRQVRRLALRRVAPARLGSRAVQPPTS